mmetsp:Transcript_23302/g.60690  ORF Transcript_23302/g.60690 Transcript_23302/m.60690 type:complete len:120 (+) Transcript_23302:1923-2282(+)
MLQKKIKAAYAGDPFFASGKCSKGFARDVSGLWMLKDKVAVPNVPELKRKLLSLCHESLMGGHPGVAKTMHLVARQFYWPGMLLIANSAHHNIASQSLWSDVVDYVRHCESCQRNKAST